MMMPCDSPSGSAPRCKSEMQFGICRILDLEALIRANLAINRDHDRITVKQLREIKRRTASAGD